MNVKEIIYVDGERHRIMDNDQVKIPYHKRIDTVRFMLNKNPKITVRGVRKRYTEMGFYPVEIRQFWYDIAKCKNQ